MNYSKLAGLSWRQCQLWLLSLACLFLFSAQAALAEIAANVSFVSGTVTASASGATARELAKGNDIFSGDTIDTSDNGRIQMRFTDGGLVSLMPGTTFSVDEYLHEGKAADDGSLVFGMLRGGMRTITGSIGKIKHENYELKTPVATLGIRGTEYVAVIGPPDTLRVHVGKGKVVITNDHGTLEVPEGRSAVVVLGSAPEFTEQGPLYVASAIGGDKSDLYGLVDQDPLWRDVVVQELASAPQSGIPPGGPGYLMLGYTDTGSGGMGAFGSGTTFTATFDQTTGDLIGLTDPSTTTNFGDLTSSNVGYLGGNISWGELNSGQTGDIAGVSISGISPYVIGSAVLNMPTTGTLIYGLAGKTIARNSGGGADGSLDSFTLTVNLDTILTYSYTGGLTGPNDSYLVTGGGPVGPTFQDGFSLSGGACVTTNGCTFSGQGFLAGPNAEQAGIIYELQDWSSSTDAFTGAAALTRP